MVKKRKHDPPQNENSGYALCDDRVQAYGLCILRRPVIIIAARSLCCHVPTSAVCLAR